MMDKRRSELSLDLQRIKRYDLNLLMVLRTLLETASVSETARRLGSTQPSVSRMLDRLRDDLGDPLLVKSANAMLRTARAQDLLPLLESMLELLHSIYRSTENYCLAQETRTCVVGANDSLQAVFTAPLIERIRLSAPKARVRFKPLPYPNPLRALKSGEVDIMVAMGDFDSSSYRDELLFDSEFSCLCARDNAAISAPATVEMLADHPYLDISHMGVISAITAEIFAKAGVSRNVAATMSSFLAAPDVISDSDLVSLVPSYLTGTLSLHPGVKVVPLMKGIVRHSIRVYWHNAMHFDPFLIGVRAMMRDIGQEIKGRLSEADTGITAPPLPPYTPRIRSAQSRPSRTRPGR